MKISFDLDNTIYGVTKEFKQIFNLCKILSKVNAFEIIFLTSRLEETWKNNFELNNWLKDNFNLDISKVIFTSMEDKYHYIDKYNIDLHFDDDEDEVKMINKHCKGKAVLVNYGENILSLYNK